MKKENRGVQRFAVRAIFALLPMLILGSSFVPVKAGNAIISLNFRIPFAPETDSAGLYAAAARYWPKLGIAGTVLPGKGSAAAVQSTAAGADQMALVDFAAAIAGIRQGVPITIVAAPEARDASGLVFTEKSGIRTLADLRGRRVGALPGAASGLFLKAALKQHGFDPNTVDWQAIPPGSLQLLMKSGKLDAGTGYIGAVNVELGCDGVATGSMRAYDLGVKSIGQVFIVNNAWAQKVGANVVSRVMLGIIRGYSLLKTHPLDAINDMFKLSPDGHFDLTQQWSLLDEKQGLVPWSFQSLDPSHGFGWLDAAHVSSSIATLEEAGVLKREQDSNLSAYFTMKYLRERGVRSAARSFNELHWARIPQSVRQQCGLS